MTGLKQLSEATFRHCSLILRACSSYDYLPDHVLSEGPVLGEDVKESEGHREGAEEDVRDRHVGDEDVPSGKHFLGNKL